MLNVNQLTEQLRMMPDQALQRMAQMYKNDPYILPMLISEDTARKKLRQAAQAQAAQPQPKVADQAIAAMGTPPQAAPGIAALQAPNMERMADGGIAGYAEGGVADTAEDAFSRGGMFDFAQRSEPVVRMADGGVARYADEGLVQSKQPYINPYVQNILALDPDFDEQGMPRTRRESEMIRAKQKEAAVQKQKAQDYAVSLDLPPPEYIKRMEDFYRPRNPAATATTPQVTAAPAAPAAGTPPAPPGAGAATAQARPPGAAAPARAPAVAQPSVEGAKQTAAQFLDKQAIEQQAKEFEMGEVTAVDEARRRRQKMIDERQGKAYEGLEGLLKKEEEGAKGELEQSKAMAILNAGLAMMAGTSPRAFENIGKGAMVGTKEYADAISNFKKAAKERQRAMADIEQARRAEARSDEEAMLKFEERADDKLSNARKFGVDALMSAGVKNADIASKIYTMQVEQQGALDRTRMQISAPPAELQTYEALGRAMGATDRNAAIQAGFGLKSREQRLPVLYDQYIARANSPKLSLTGKGTEGEEFLKQYPTFETYLRGMNVQPGMTTGKPGGGFVQPPAGAPILR